MPFRKTAVAFGQPEWPARAFRYLSDFCKKITARRQKVNGRGAIERIARELDVTPDDHGFLSEELKHEEALARILEHICRDATRSG
ncbi:MAG: hypothetical protein ACYSWU_00830 [Planctomycetota bacterium]|jgi:hypothetical protein